MAKVNSDNSNRSGSLRDNRIIYVNGVFNEGMAKNIIEDLFLFEIENCKKDVVMFIDSYGGSIHSLLAIYDAMKMVRCPIATVAIGKAFSCGQMLLMSGAKGKRFATKHSRILMHEMSGGSIGKLTDIEVHTKEMSELETILIQIALDNSKMKKTQIEEFLRKEVYMSPKDAKKYGIIDHIIEDRNDLYSRVNI